MQQLICTRCLSGLPSHSSKQLSRTRWLLCAIYTSSFWQKTVWIALRNWKRRHIWIITHLSAFSLITYFKYNNNSSPIAPILMCLLSLKFQRLFYGKWVPKPCHSFQCLLSVLWGLSFNLLAAARVSSWVLSKNCPQLKRTTSPKFMLLSQGQPPFNDETRCGLDSWSQGWRTLKIKLAQHSSQHWPRPQLQTHHNSNSPQHNPGFLTSDSCCSPTAFPFNHLRVNLRVCFLGKPKTYTTVSRIKKRERHLKLKST